MGGGKFSVGGGLKDPVLKVINSYFVYTTLWGNDVYLSHSLGHVSSIHFNPIPPGVYMTPNSIFSKSLPNGSRYDVETL